MKQDILNKNEDTNLFVKDGPVLINYINLFKVWDYGSISGEEKSFIWENYTTCATSQCNMLI